MHALTLSPAARELSQRASLGSVFTAGSRTMRMRFSRTAHCHPDRAHKGEWSGSPKPQEAVLGMMYAPYFFGRSMIAPTRLRDKKYSCRRIASASHLGRGGGEADGEGGLPPLTRCAGALPKGEPWGGGKVCGRIVGRGCGRSLIARLLGIPAHTRLCTARYGYVGLPQQGMKEPQAVLWGPRSGR